MTELLLKFFIYSVLGWGCECLWHFVWNGHFREKRMLLNLPMCPVYGLGGVCLSYLLTGFYDNILSLYLLGALLASAVELLYYLICAQAFGIMIWDYSNMPANFAGGICIGYSLLWGFLAVAVVRMLDPAVDFLLGKLAENTKLTAAVFLSVLTAADMRKTAEILRNYGRGETEKLPQCFWYIEKISEKFTKE